MKQVPVFSDHLSSTCLGFFFCKLFTSSSSSQEALGQLIIDLNCFFQVSIVAHGPLVVYGNLIYMYTPADIEFLMTTYHCLTKYAFKLFDIFFVLFNKLL